MCEGVSGRVCISGSGFGASQGTGSVYLGSTIGTVVSWADNMIVATVASNAQTGIVQVQQGGVWVVYQDQNQNPITFTVNTATITGVSPSSAAAGTPITITGSYFGSAPGQVFIGNANGVVVSWSDTQVVAQVASQAMPGSSGVQILQNGVMSNAYSPFTVGDCTLHRSPLAAYPAQYK